MKFIGDLHIHSSYSLATSKNLQPEWLDYWASLKGIQVVGTGDITHPKWLHDLKEKLSPAEKGLYTLKQEYLYSFEKQHALTAARKCFISAGQKTLAAKKTPAGQKGTRFLLTGEVSTIYKKNERVRKVHHLLLIPDFEAAENLQKRLAAIGNITSDGRPILGLDSRNLLEIMLEAAPGSMLVPAHIWTPWFSVLGAKSGFDTISECYGDLADHIKAVETGLSSDPPMNRLCSFLDNYTLISNSDAHSPEKLGREANLFEADLSFPGIVGAITNGNKLSGADNTMPGTVEFFPQEGKYHHDGHRKCGINWDPQVSMRNNGKCTVCGKPVTQGVLHRVHQLSDRAEPAVQSQCFSLVPLKEVFSEILLVGPNSKKVDKAYRELLHKIGSEFDVLLHMSLSDVKTAGGDLLAEAIGRMRRGQVFIKAGYDGEFGRITLFAPGELGKA